MAFAALEAMLSVVELEICADRETVAELYCDPANNPKWMDDLVRWDRLRGEPGTPGSKYRMLSRDPDMEFVVTILDRADDHIRFVLDSADVVVSIHVTFTPSGPGTTRFVSREQFRFQGLRRRIVGALATRAIRKAHRNHVSAFKRFAEADQVRSDLQPLGRR
jgi:hypothetical protein